MAAWFDVVKDLITNYHFDPQETDDEGNRGVNQLLDILILGHF